MIYDTLLELTLKLRALARIGQSSQLYESGTEVMVSYLKVIEDMTEEMIIILDNIEFDHKQPSA